MPQHFRLTNFPFKLVRFSRIARSAHHQPSTEYPLQERRYTVQCSPRTHHSILFENGESAVLLCACLFACVWCWWMCWLWIRVLRRMAASVMRAYSECGAKSVVTTATPYQNKYVSTHWLAADWNANGVEMLCECVHDVYMYLKLRKSQEISVCIRLCVLYFSLLFFVVFFPHSLATSIRFSRVSLCTMNTIRIVHTIQARTHTPHIESYFVLSFFRNHCDVFMPFRFQRWYRRCVCQLKLYYVQSLPRCSSGRSSVEFETLFESEVLVHVVLVRFSLLYYCGYLNKDFVPDQKKKDEEFSVFIFLLAELLAVSTSVYRWFKLLAILETTWNFWILSFVVLMSVRLIQSERDFVVDLPLVKLMEAGKKLRRVAECIPSEQKHRSVLWCAKCFDFKFLYLIFVSLTLVRISHSALVHALKH